MIKDNTGVYIVKCLSNNRIYIGSSHNIKGRIANHFNKLLRNNHYNNKLQNDYNIYGKENFLYYIHTVCDKSDTSKLERLAIKDLSPYYNDTVVSDDISLTYEEVIKYLSKIRQTDNSTGCWSYLNNKVKYSRVYTKGGKYKLSHRISFFIFNGYFEPSLFVCHSCDNKWCCNPSHLFLGTAHDNSTDYANKGKIAGAMSLEIANEIRTLYNDNDYAINDIKNLINNKYNILIRERSIYPILNNKSYINKNYTRVRSGNRFVTQEIATLIRKDYFDGILPASLAIKYNLKYATIKSVIYNQNFKNADYDQKCATQYKSKVPAEIVLEMRSMYKSGIETDEIAARFAKNIWTTKSIIYNVIHKDPNYNGRKG